MLQENGVGWIAFSPLAGGLLTDRYLHGIPQDSRAASGSRFLQPEASSPPEKLDKVRRLDALARQRGQKLSQMALAWVLRGDRITSVLIGASKKAQIEDAVGMLANRHFTAEELVPPSSKFWCNRLPARTFPGAVLSRKRCATFRCALLVQRLKSQPTRRVLPCR